MQGITKVIVFCTLTAVLPILLLVAPLYLRHSLYASVTYSVAESDIMEIEDGISTIFCSEHTLKMDKPFHAFKVSQQPEMTSYRKHIRLKKSMTLPDDTLEYWGFYLLKGATVALSVCSRFQGASILVVKGERSLRTCGMMKHNENKRSFGELEAAQQVQVTFQSNAQVINSQENQIPHKVNASIDSAAPDVKDSSNATDFELEMLRKAAMKHIQKHTLGKNGTMNGLERLRHMRQRLHNRLNNTRSMKDQEMKNSTESDVKTRAKRHSIDKSRKEQIRLLESVLNSDSEPLGEYAEDEKVLSRAKRSPNGINPSFLLDRGIEHGGNALNFTPSDEDSSLSSFENGLLTCYDGQVLLAQQFEPSELCTNVSFLLNSKRMQTQHNVVESGYYYYIFYSDNDFVSNDMHAIFDIYKPTFQYENLTESCLNQTECSFSIDFLSADRVIVEVPTKDGIDDADDDVTLLISTCHPRMSIYTIFPIAVLLLILGCAFM